MQRTVLMARHALLRHLRRPGFILLTLAVPLIGLVVTLVMGTVMQDAATAQVGGDMPGDSNGTIGYVDQASLIEQVPESIPDARLRAFPDVDAARAAVQDGDITAFYLIPADYLETGSVTRFAPQMQIATPNEPLIRRLIRANLLPGADTRRAERLVSPLSLETVRLDAEGQPAPAERGQTDGDNPLTFAVPYIFAMMLFITIISSSGFMLQSVTEEKENRTIEILLTSLRPWQILAGKVAGLGLLGLIQVSIWLLAARLLLTLSTRQFNLFGSFELPGYVWGLALLYFVLGYLVYASLLAGVGATVTTTREGSQLTTLVVLPFIVPLWFIGAIIEQPDSPLALALSLVPLTAPVTMVMRLALTDVVWWQVLLSLLLLLGTVLLFVWGAGRIFRVTTLLAGKKFNVGEIFQALRTGSAG
jgi:ABC-2 type transport system permease protein